MSSGWAASAPTAGTRSASPSPSPRCSPPRRRVVRRLLRRSGASRTPLVADRGDRRGPGAGARRRPRVLAGRRRRRAHRSRLRVRHGAPSEPGRPGPAPRPTNVAATTRIEAPAARAGHHRPRRQPGRLRRRADGRRRPADHVAHRRRRLGRHDPLHPAPPDDADPRRAGQRLRQGGAQRRLLVDWYPLNRRITSVEWVFDDGTTVGQDLREVRRMQGVRIDPVTTRTVQLRILGVTAPGRARWAATTPRSARSCSRAPAPEARRHATAGPDRGPAARRTTGVTSPRTASPGPGPRRAGRRAR